MRSNLFLGNDRATDEQFDEALKVACAYDFVYEKGGLDEKVAEGGKNFSGGQRLDGKTSPFGQALTQEQCIQYALDKPGVLTVLPGFQTVAEVQRLLHFFDSSDAERDYAILGSFTPKDAAGGKKDEPPAIFFDFFSFLEK